MLDNPPVGVEKEDVDYVNGPGAVYTHRWCVHTDDCAAGSAGACCDGVPDRAEQLVTAAARNRTRRSPARTSRIP